MLLCYVINYHTAIHVCLQLEINIASHHYHRHHYHHRHHQFLTQTPSHWRWWVQTSAIHCLQSFCQIQCSSPYISGSRIAMTSFILYVTLSSVVSLYLARFLFPSTLACSPWAEHWPWVGGKPKIILQALHKFFKENFGTTFLEKIPADLFSESYFEMCNDKASDANTCMLS